MCAREDEEYLEILLSNVCLDLPGGTPTNLNRIVYNYPT
jgi:hypothetical protein